MGSRAMAKHRKRTSSVDENASGGSGVVLSMDMISTSYYAVAYTVPVQVGPSQQNLSLQVDTGSSDLWIASKSCSSASCSGTSGRLYDPSSSQSTGANFSIEYLAGTVNGPVVWDQVQIGGYLVQNQALAAATTVSNEPLSYGFDGVLGLALPSNSLILQAVPAGTTLSTNLFSLTPTTDAPSQPFLSLTFARPGSNRIPSLLGIGSHPSTVVPDPSQIRYSPIFDQSVDSLFWKTTVKAITVYVNGQARPVALQSIYGATEPTALLDSGVPLILTTPALANGIYGALDIGPASDGNYYVPCATPLNMTITLDGQDEIPLHPLDLTTEPEGQTSEYCMGMIQSDPSQLTPASDIGDMVLGVPFMRNVYTVLAYQQPDATGAFSSSSAESEAYPTLGLLGLTNATQALQEFDQVRVAKQPLDGGSAEQSSLSSGGDPSLTIGVKILIGLIGFFALSLVLFALRCILMRRRWRDRERIAEERARASEKTGYGTTKDDDDSREFGVRRKRAETPTALDNPWDPHAGTWSTIIGTDAGASSSSLAKTKRSSSSTSSSSSSLSSSSIYSYYHSHSHSRPYVAPRELGLGPGTPYSPEMTLVSGLLAHDRNDSQASDDLAEFGMHMPLRGGMAGIGTAARGSVIDAELQYVHAPGRPSDESARSSVPLRQTRSTHSRSSLQSSYTGDQTL